MKIYLLPEKENFYKANMHAHTTVSDGCWTPEQAKEMAKNADGVIVGSAIVKICAKYGKDCVPYVADYVKSMKEAIS